MKRLTWIAFSLLPLLAISSGVSVGANAAERPAVRDVGPLTLVAATDDDVQFVVRTPAVKTATVQTRGGRFVRIDLPGFDRYGLVGEAALPAIRKIIDLPLAAKVSVSAEADSVQIIPIRGLVIPNQPSVEKIPGALEHAPFVFKGGAYAADAKVIGRYAAVVEEGLMRNHRLALLEITPVDYNPVRGELTLARELKVTVHLEGPDLTATEALAQRHGNRVFDEISTTLAANPAHWTRFSAPAAGADYLIIYADAFAGSAPLSALLSLKQGDGWTVTMADVKTIGRTAAAIKRYIVGAYNSLPNLTFVLLVGDTDTIINGLGVTKSAPPTDLYYSCIDAGDYFPDVLLGRLPVRSLADLGVVVAKIASYEAQAGAWQKTGTFMASKDHYAVSEGTHDSVIGNFLDPNGYASNRLYCHTYNATTAEVSAAFNAGTNYGIFSGHGTVLSWVDGPVFNRAGVRALTATNYPFVCCFACSTGRYTANECFAETWVRAAGGASAVLASSVTSYWDEDDWFERNMFSMLFTTPIPDYPRQVWVGSTVLAGKFGVWLKSNNNSGHTRRYFEQYNLFGDPSMVLYTF